MKSRLKDIILEFIKGELPPLHQRLLETPALPPQIRKALVFIGMRRVGKTFLMFQDMKKRLDQGVPKEKLLYINFEDDRLIDFTVKDFQTLLDAYFELYPDHTEDLCFYFDEIQNIEGWDKFIRRLIDKEKMSIFITGSSAKSLSKEIATSLRGRSLATEVFPLSFFEYLHYQGIREFQHLTSKQKAVILHHCQTYLKRGGFPETLELSESLHHRTIQSYVNAAVFRDVIDRHKLKNPHLVKLFLTQCLQNIAAPMSITKIYKDLKSRGESVGRNSLYEYLRYFEDAYLLCTVPIFDLSARKRQVNPKKIYVVDSGIISGYTMKPQTELGASLENAVYLHLRQNAQGEIFYYKTDSGREIDFLIQKENGEIELIQVCLKLENKTTRNRELQAIVEAADELEVNKGKIITMDTNETVKYSDLTVEVIPYWQWVL